MLGYLESAKRAIEHGAPGDTDEARAARRATFAWAEEQGRDLLFRSVFGDATTAMAVALGPLHAYAAGYAAGLSAGRGQR